MKINMGNICIQNKTNYFVFNQDEYLYEKIEDLNNIELNSHDEIYIEQYTTCFNCITIKKANDYKPLFIVQSEME